MGFWGTKLYQNDTTCDVRDTYMECLREKQMSNEDAYSFVLEEYNDCMGTDEEPLFWYALADTQWKVGRLSDDVREKARSLILADASLDLFEKEDPKMLSKWKETLSALAEKLDSPQPKEKKLRKPILVNSDLWEVGDVYACPLQSDFAKEKNFSGKYFVMQKVSSEDACYGSVRMRVQIFNKLFDAPPSIEELKDIRQLPTDLGAWALENPVALNIGIELNPIRNAKKHIPEIVYMGNAPIGNVNDSYKDNYMMWWQADEFVSALLDYWNEHRYYISDEGMAVYY